MYQLIGKTLKVLFLSVACAQIVTLLTTAAALADSYADGVRYYSQRNYRQAAQQFEQVVRNSPADSNALYYLGVSYQAMGDVARARNCYQQVLQKFPGSEAARMVAPALGASANPTNSPAGTSGTLRPTNIGAAQTIAVPGNRAQLQVNDDLSSLPNQSKLPFRRMGDLFFSARLNNKPITMIFDTGAAVCVFGKNNLAQLGIAAPTGAAVGSAVGVGSQGAVPIWAMRVDLTVGDITRHDFPIMVQEQLSTPLLGQTFLKDFEYTIDNQNNVINLVKKTSALAGQAVGSYVPFRREGVHLIVDVDVNGRNLPMIFDTGADGVVFSKAQADGLGISIPANAIKTQSGGIAGSTPTWIFPISLLRLGPIDQFNLPIAVVQDAGMSHPLLGQSFYKDWQYSIDNDRQLIKFQRR